MTRQRLHDLEPPIAFRHSLPPAGPARPRNRRTYGRMRGLCATCSRHLLLQCNLLTTVYSIENRYSMHSKPLGMKTSPYRSATIEGTTYRNYGNCLHRFSSAPQRSVHARYARAFPQPDTDFPRRTSELNGPSHPWNHYHKAIPWIRVRR